MKRRPAMAVVVISLLVLGLAAAAFAAPVGRFTHVEGYVDLLRQGKFPAAAAKVQDGVEAGDVVRTKSRSKAVVQFVDDTTVTIAPESRVAIADYVFDPAKSERRATLKVFRGLVHTVVSRVFQVAQPDFVMETFTAELGVRGTEWYTLLKPNATLVFLIRGLMRVKSSDSRVIGAFSLQGGQFITAKLGQLPGPIRAITPEDLDLLRKLMDTGVPDSPLFEVPGEKGAPIRAFQVIPGSPEDTMQPIISPILTGPQKRGGN
jgi:hypothetical protein